MFEIIESYPTQDEALALLRQHGIISDFEDLQRTEKWYKDRCGKITGSRVKDALSKLKNGSRSKAAKTLMGKIVAERLTGVSADGDISNLRAVQHGIVTEKLAVEAFEKVTGKKVQLVGLIDHPTLHMCGASPDGLIDDDAVLEIKCPNSATHIEYLKGNCIPEEYVEQTLWQLACTGRTKRIFVSFDPRMPPANQLLIVEDVPDVSLIRELEEEVKEVLSEIEEDVKFLKGGVE